MPRLSIVTITWNDSEGLVRTRDSLPGRGFEWIVIDGSTETLSQDKNNEALYGREVIHVQEPDSGRFHAMNKGLDLASGEIICFLNSGDTFQSKEVVEKVVNSFDSLGWLWAVGNTKAINGQGDTLWNWPMPRHNSLKLKVGVNSYCHQATFVQVEELRAMKGFEENSLYSDWALSLRLSKMVRPHLLGFDTTFFLTNGISSQQTIDYWRRESQRLRVTHNSLILNSTIIDRSLQYLAAKFISSTRGQLIRPDLVKKYS